MGFSTDTALANAGTAVANSLSSKVLLVRKTLLAHHHSSLDVMLDYKMVEKGDACIITMADTIDITVALELHELLANCVAKKQNIIICMSDVLHFDSAGAATIVDAYATARSHALGFILVAVSQNARQTINLCCLNEVLPMCERIEDAQHCIHRHRTCRKDKH